MTHPHHTGSCKDACCLKVESLGVKIGEQQILENVHLHLHCGQMAALIGPNGAGKSTLLRAILGQQAYTGHILFSTPGHAQQKPRIGYVPQNPSFEKTNPITVQDLFAASTLPRAAFLPLPRKNRQKILQALQTVHAEALIDKRVGTLSGGELQRVLLALALQPMPNILILDEPLSGVDVEGMTLLMDMLDEIRTQFDLSILMITHDFSMLRRYVDQVILLKKTVLCQGMPDAVLRDPAFLQVFHLEGGML